MTKRFWLYLMALIIAAGLVAYWNWENAHLNTTVAAINARASKEAASNLTNFLAKQTSAGSLISLAKRLQSNDPNLVRPVVEKAYELAPTNPDAVWLVSAYRPELKAKALELNPLLDQKVNPDAPFGQLR